MEYSSSSALLHLSHRLYLCTYYGSVYIIIDIIKPEPQLKRGLCLSYHAWLHGVVLFKAAPGLPLDICFLYITGGLGRVRTNEHPLIGDSHQIIWGHGQV